jgi:excinuclease UvrABC nuclease subunit
VRLLLVGRNSVLADTLVERMGHASVEMRYEMAAKYRDLR